MLNHEILRIHESNQLGDSRVWLTQSRLPTLHKKLYESFTFLRSKNAEVSGFDFITKANEIKKNFLSENVLDKKEKGILEKFKATKGFIENFKNRQNI